VTQKADPVADHGGAAWTSAAALVVFFGGVAWLYRAIKVSAAR
jgi:hypothetical protein